MYLILTGLAIAAVCGFLYQVWYCRRGPSTAKSIVKTTAIAMLAVVSAYMDGPIMLTLGLALCALGDFFLSRDGQRAFLFGLIAFAAGHVCYIILFAGLGDFAVLMQSPWLIFVLLLIFIGTFMGRVLWSVTGDLRMPVMIYIMVIIAMGLSAISMTGGGVTLPALGAGLFVLSDMILSAELFLLRDESRAKRFTPLFIWLLYWMAQVAIFVGILAQTSQFQAF